MRNGERIVNAVMVLVIVVVAGAILWNMQEPEAPSTTRPDAGPRRPAAAAGPDATAVLVSPVDTGTVRTTVRTNGEVVVRNQVHVFSTVAGRVATAPPPIGATVQQGQSVAVIDPSRPGETFSLSTVTSPVGGTVTAAGANVGDTVTTQTTLLTVSDLSRLEVRTWIPERFIGLLRPGLTATLTFEAYPGETFAARVTRLAPQLDPASRTLEITLELTAPDRRVRPGMFATVELVTRERSGVLTVPRSAVLESWQEHYVFVVDADGVARRRPVTLGLEGAGTVEVTQGLEREEQLVTRGQTFLTDGVPVRIVEDRI